MNESRLVGALIGNILYRSQYLGAPTAVRAHLEFGRLALLGVASPCDAVALTTALSAPGLTCSTLAGERASNTLEAYLAGHEEAAFENVLAVGLAHASCVIEELDGSLEELRVPDSIRPEWVAAAVTSALRWAEPGDDNTVAAELSAFVDAARLLPHRFRTGEVDASVVREALVGLVAEHP